MFLVLGEMKKREVVTAFIEHSGRVLVLRRSHEVRTYQGRWAGVSGSVEKSPDEQVMQEITEETGLGCSDISLVRRGEPLEVVDEGKDITWVVHTYLFHAQKPELIRLDWEHVEMRWIDPGEMDQLDTVPGLKQALARVWQEGE